MKVLYCNPIFFEYRLPFYKKLVELFSGEFYVMYSPIRYKLCHKENFCKQIKEELGENAVEMRSEHLFDTNSMKCDEMPDIEKGKRIPLIRGLLRAIGKVKPDILITEGYFQWTPLVLLYSWLHHVPVYMGYERTCWTERNCHGLKLYQRKLFNKWFAGFIVNGSETRKYLRSIGVEDERIFVGGMSADSSKLKEIVAKIRLSNKIINAIDSTILLKNSKQSQNIEIKNSLTFLFTGVVAERKGIKFLLEAWIDHVIKHREDELVIVGDGNQLEECKMLMKDVDSVKFAGRVPYEQMGEQYAHADVYILPTIEDNWSLVIPEAMACGLPVATSIYNGCHPELIKEGVNGWTFDTFKHESIVEVLDKFHHADLKAMGEESIKIEEPFNAENSAQRMYNALTRKNED